MQEKTLWPLFSKPIFKTYVDLESLDLSQVKWAQNYNNWISDNQHIIQQPEFEKISEQVYHNVCEYFYGVMRASNDVEIYITESWLNKTEKGQVHHRHWHPNSILSGIVYLQGDPTSGRTSFITSQFDTLEYTIEESNLYNSRSWSVDPEVGSMLVFPSNVEHLVEEYLGEEPRITMSFNTFIRGDINKDPLLQLSI